MNKEEISFRKAEEPELKVIKNSILKFFGKEATEVIFSKHLWIREGKIREVFALSEDINEAASSLDIKLYSAGTPIGSLWEEGFQLEIEGALMITNLTNKKLIVNTDQFLYGKSIFKENIEECKDSFNSGDLLIIFGKNKLHFGVGKAIIDSNKITESPPNTIVVKGYPNKPFDRGWYLRKGN